MNTGDLVKLRIDSIAYRGAGVARSDDGCVVFTPGVCEGEAVEARITRLHPRFAEAELVTVEKPARGRIDPVCRVNGVRVPGCVYDHMSYDAEIAAKADQFRGFISRQAKVDNFSDICGEPFPSPRDLHYRNKIVLHAQRRRGSLVLGYLGEDNVTVIDIPQCPLAVPEINEKLASLRADAKFMDSLHDGDEVTLRWSSLKGVISWVGDTQRNLPPLKEHALFGDVEIPAGAFYQVNPFASGELVRRVSEFVKSEKPRAVVDVYCGVGVFALAAAAAGAGRCLGIESGRAAIAAARRNSERLGLPAEFGCMPADEGLDSALFEVMHSHSSGVCVILDPPRDGLDPRMRSMLERHRPDTVLYVSCSPDTLARDILELKERAGYEVESTSLIDMFPRTAHFETFTVLRRG